MSSKHKYTVVAVREDHTAGDGGEFQATSNADAIRQFKRLAKGRDFKGWVITAHRATAQEPEVAPEDRPGKA